MHLLKVLSPSLDDKDTSTLEDKDASVACLLPEEVTEERLLLLAAFWVVVPAAVNTGISSRGCVVELDVLGLEGEQLCREELFLKKLNTEVCLTLVDDLGTKSSVSTCCAVELKDLFNNRFVCCKY